MAGLPPSLGLDREQRERERERCNPRDIIYSTWRVVQIVCACTRRTSVSLQDKEAIQFCNTILTGVTSAIPNYNIHSTSNDIS